MQNKEITIELYTNTLAPGIILKGDCFDSNGVKYIDSSKPVTFEEVEKIKKAGIKKLFYKTAKLSIKFDTEPVIISNSSVGKAYSIMQDIQNGLLKNKFSVPSSELDNVVENFINDINDNKNAYLNLLDVSDIDEYTYTHSINVSTISIMMGLVMSLDYRSVVNLGISGLLIDIGKGMVPREILLKKDSLTSEELKLIRNHPVYGYNLLKSEPSINQEILDGVLMHHEHYMGGGYPLNINHEKMSYMPQVLAIADTFDAATSYKPYRNSNPHTEVISYIMENSGKKFNPIYSQTFLNHMIKKLFDKPIYYEGAYILLNTGEIAYVVAHSGDPFSLRPIINIIFSPKSKDKVLKYHQQINLEKDFERVIVRRIDDFDTVEKLVRMECKGDISCIKEKQAGLHKEGY